MKFVSKPHLIEAITFAELVEIGKASGANLVDGMPWSFEYLGHPVTHETDDLYIVNKPDGEVLRFGRDDMLVGGSEDELDIASREVFEDLYEPGDEPGVAPDLAPAGEISSRPPPAPLEDIGEVDAVSFAARVAQTAAAEFCGLMAYGEPVPIVPWYDPARTPRELERVTADVMALAGYVTGRDVDQGERLWRWAIEKRIVAGSPDGFGLLPFAVAGAYVLFVENCRRTVRHIELEQKRAADRKAAAARTEPPKLKLEDTIYEPVEPMSAMRPEAVAAIPLIANYEAGQAEALLQRQLEASEKERQRLAAEVAKMDPDGDGRVGGGKAKPQSIGEAPARPPAGNRGGRPKKAK